MCCGDVTIKLILFEFHVFSKKEHNPNGSCGGVALAVCVEGKFSDWFKILQGSKPISV